MFARIKSLARRAYFAVVALLVLIASVFKAGAQSVKEDLKTNKAMRMVYAGFAMYLLGVFALLVAAYGWIGALVTMAIILAKSIAFGILTTCTTVLIFLTLGKLAAMYKAFKTPKVIHGLAFNPTVVKHL